MKKCSAVCYINSKDKFINAFAIHTSSRVVIDLSKPLKNYYANIADLVKHLVNLANENGFEIPFYDAFGGKCYDILFIDSEKPFSVQRFIVA